MSRASHFSIRKALSAGLAATLQRWPTLIGLSLLYFLPELSERLAWGLWPSWVSRPYHIVVIFFLCFEALRSRGLAAHQKKSKSVSGFLVGNFLFWGGQATCAWLGYVLAAGLMQVMNWPPYDWAELSQRITHLPDLWTYLQSLPGGPVRALALLALAGIWPVYFFCRFDFFAYALLDLGLGPWTALGRAWVLTQGRWPRLLLYYAVCMSLNGLGLTLYFVGLVFTFPLTVAATADLYKQLSRNA